MILKHNTQHTNKHPHHGELPPPTAARILWLEPIQRKGGADKNMVEGEGEAI
jgi:hypothetical protein